MAKKNAYSEEELISAGIITEEGVVIDPVRFRQYNAVLDVEKETKEREAENLKRAEEKEDIILGLGKPKKSKEPVDEESKEPVDEESREPGVLGRMFFRGIDAVKGLMQRGDAKKKEQQKALEQKKRQQMAAGRGE